MVSGPGSPFPEVCAADCSCEPYDYGESPSGSKEWGPTESSKGLMDQENFIRKCFISLLLYLDVENNVLSLKFASPLNVRCSSADLGKHDSFFSSSVTVNKCKLLKR